MAVSTVYDTRTSETRTSLLEDKGLVDGYADWKGRPVSSSKSGGWKSASFILGAGSIERFAYYGIETNLVNYLTGQLGESVATAAANVNIWIGLNWFLPISGAFLADSFLGRYGTIVLTSVLYILGLGSLTLLAIVQTCSSEGTTKNNATGSDTVLEILVYISLYLVTVAQGYKPCVQAFGADQFDGKHPRESKANRSFFNWWFGGLCVGGVVTHLTLHYIQDHINWGFGFGIPCLSMIVSLALFLLGTRTYRLAIRRSDKESPHESSIIQRSDRVSESLHNAIPAAASAEVNGSSQNLNLNSATDNSKDNAISCCSNWIKEAKRVRRLFPIWTPCLAYAIAYAQGSTLFTKQATTIDKSIGPNLQVPAASLRTFLPLSIIIFTPIYDRVFVPTARMITKKPSGITMLQRIGIGIAMCVITMVIAALIEKKRLEIAQEYGLVDIPNAIVPMSFWWLVPHYVLFGLADIFTLVGMQEFFYHQVPSEMRSVGLSLYWSAIGIGNFLSSFLISTIQRATSRDGGEGWFNDNLNRAHVDYFYWVLAAIGAVGLVFFVIFAKSYNYRDGE